MACRRSQFALAVALWAAVAYAQAPSETADASASDAQQPGAAAQSPASQPSIGNEPVPPQKSGIEEKHVGDSGGNGSLKGDWIQTLLGLAVVIGLILVLRYALRHYAGRRGGLGPAKVFDVLVRTPVGARQQMLLVRVGRRLLVLGAGTDGLRTLAEIQDPQETAELLGAVEQGKAGSLTNNFARILHGRPGKDAEDLLPAAEDETLEADGSGPTSAGGAATHLQGMLSRLRRGAAGQGETP